MTESSGRTVMGDCVAKSAYATEVTSISGCAKSWEFRAFRLLTESRTRMRMLNDFIVRCAKKHCPGLLNPQAKTDIVGAIPVLGGVQHNYRRAAWLLTNCSCSLRL